MKEFKKRICPRCGKEYSEYPALSRKDKTNICPDCGTLEALEDYFNIPYEGIKYYEEN